MYVITLLCHVSSLLLNLFCFVCGTVVVALLLFFMVLIRVAMYFLLQLVVLLRMIVCVYFDVDANFVCKAYAVVVVVVAFF